MTELADLKRRRSSFDIDGQKLDLIALSASDIAILFERFEKLGDLAEKPVVDVLRAAGASACGAIIAAGVGKLGDEKTEREAVKNISFGDQVDIIDLLIEITAPRGDRPLAKGLSELVSLLLPIARVQVAVAAASSPASSPSLSPISKTDGPAINASGTSAQDKSSPGSS